MSFNQVIIVGGGLAGLSAVHTVLEKGGRVLLLDKNPFLGGNSTKATSGINGALTRTQMEKGIPDSAKQFEEDTALSAAGGVKGVPASPLAKVLTHQSAAAVDWLTDAFGLDLSLVSRLGGHSQPRTHRGKEKFPGMTITYALMEKLEMIAEKQPEKARVLIKARATRLLTDANGNVTGVEYEYEGKTFQEYGPVVIATGGFAADFTDDSLLKKLRPELMHLPTTNGEHCTGDGIKMAMTIGADSVDLDHVQVHPTGLVHPEEPDAKVKWLAAEALRGVGGILLDNNGKRFCNELGRRDYVTGEMWKNKGPFRLVLNSAGAKEIEWHVKHYMGRGLMKKFDSGAALAAEIGCSVDVLKETFEKYNQAAKTSSDEYGKKYYHNVPFLISDQFYVSFVTPVLHYCMGGIKISPEAEVQTSTRTILGLFAAGEVVGGVHGKNRLGGSSLLDCVVFGRVAGESAAKYLLSHLIYTKADLQTAQKRAGAIAKQITAPLSGSTKIGATIIQGGVQTEVNVDPEAKQVSMNIVWSDQTQAPAIETLPSVQVTTPPVVAAPISFKEETKASASTTESKPAAQTPPSSKRPLTMEEVAKHNTEKDCWVVVNGQVLDATNFLKDHPGGKKAILLYAGKDASEEFNMLHKPDVVEKYAPYTILGKLEPSSGSSSPPSSSNPTSSNPAPSSPPSSSASPVSSASSAASFVDWTKSNNPMSLKPLEKAVASDKQSRLSGGTANILAAERAKATFQVEKLTNFLDGGEEATRRRRFIISPGKGLDEITINKYYWDRPELMKQHIKLFMEMHDEYLGKILPAREDFTWMSEYSMIKGSLMNHYGLFLPTLDLQAGDDQKAQWLWRALMLQIVGCYAQTELGHGSNVRGLQTTAVYDKSTEEFVLNTPTLQSIKWWPGTLGKVCTHALLYAQLIIDGKEYGVHTFMVQIRDENHRPLPGIEVGDLGPKMGDEANDTGFLRLDDVRIPREHMLNRYQQVTPDGQYIKSEKKKNDRLHYATMMFTRGNMAKVAGGMLARACTIGIRYSCVRRQGFVDTKKGKQVSFKSEERQIIDYQVQRYRLFKQLALAYAIKFSGKWMIDRFKELEGNLAEAPELPEVAATSAGLKAMATYLASQGIEDCRKCCGGNGYLLSSGIGQLSSDYVWETTAEGDWIILLLQTARFLLKSLSNARKGEPLSGPCDYLNPLKDSNFKLSQSAPRPAHKPEDFSNLDYLHQLFKYKTLVSVVSVGEEVSRKMASGQSYDDAFNSSAIELINAVFSHCYTFLLRNFMVEISKVQDKAISQVLSKLCALFACSLIADNQWAGILDGAQLSLMKKNLVSLLEELRPNAVALVDAFDFPDRTLNSTIGAYDGNVYERLYESAKKAPLNQTDPFKGYEEVLRPRLDLDYLKLNCNKTPVSKM